MKKKLTKKELDPFKKALDTAHPLPGHYRVKLAKTGRVSITPLPEKGPFGPKPKGLSEQHYRELGCLLGRKQAFEEVVQLLYPLIGKWSCTRTPRLEELTALVQKLNEASHNAWNLYNEKDR